MYTLTHFHTQSLFFFSHLRPPLCGYFYLSGVAYDHLELVDAKASQIESYHLFKFMMHLFLYVTKTHLQNILFFFKFFTGTLDIAVSLDNNSLIHVTQGISVIQRCQANKFTLIPENHWFVQRLIEVIYFQLTGGFAQNMKCISAVGKKVEVCAQLFHYTKFPRMF